LTIATLHKYTYLITYFVTGAQITLNTFCASYAKQVMLTPLSIR